MKVAVWLDNGYSPNVGGSFSYTNKLVQAIDDYQFDERLDVCFVSLTPVKKGVLKKDVIILTSPLMKLAKTLGGIRKGFTSLGRYYTMKYFNSSLKHQLEEHNIKILYYTTQFNVIIKNFPFVVSHWDIAHRSTYAFPEFSEVLQVERDRFYEDIFPRALMLFAESETGKQELLRYSWINEDRIRIVPLFAGNCADFDVSEVVQKDILEKYGIKKFEYFFYPAQFLAEKNHSAILHALSIIKVHYPQYKVVFTGSHSERLKGTLPFVKELAAKLGLSDKVIIPGFVPLEYLYVFYKNACAHIMASYVGPTNMPPLEAMEIGCPVICTDLGGHRDELGDAAIYFNPKRIDQLADAMIEMINKRDIYVDKIKAQAKVCTYTVENAMKAIESNLLEATIIRSTWK